MKKLLLVLALFMLLACGSNSQASVDESYSVTTESVSDQNGLKASDEAFEGDYNINQTDSVAAENRKLIKNFNLDVDTENYLDAKKIINEAIVNNGGYIQNNSENHYEFYSSYYVIRIPSKNTSKFLEDISNIGVTKSSSLDVNDVTESYSDIEARLKTLYIEEETYQNILKEANNVTDVLEIQRALSDTRYQIESYETSKKNYDLLVANDTITINLREVKIAVSEDDSIIKDISTTFNNSVDNLVAVLRALVVFVFGNIINIAIFGVIVYIIARLIKKNLSNKKITKKPDSEDEIL